MTMSAGGVKKVAILGASGYTGAELMRSDSNWAQESHHKPKVDNVYDKVLQK